MINQTSVAFNRDLSLIVPIVIQTEIGFQRLTTIRTPKSSVCAQAFRGYNILGFN